MSYPVDIIKGSMTLQMKTIAQEAQKALPLQDYGPSHQFQCYNFSENEFTEVVGPKKRNQSELKKIESEKKKIKLQKDEEGSQEKE